MKKASRPPRVPESELPDFDRPPAVETFLGFHFASLQNWKTQYFGLFWQEIKDEYPDVQVLPPIPGEDVVRIELDAQRVNLKVQGQIPVRWWYLHADGRRLIQIQSNRFIQNWRKRDAEDKYVHYADLKPSFLEVWERFVSFLKKHEVEAPKIHLCEICYVNNIDRGDAWHNFSDLHKVISGWSGKGATGFLPNPNLVTLNTVYPISAASGTLHVVMEPGRRQSDSTDVIQLSLTAHCRPSSARPGDLSAGLDLGREWIVRGFEDFTTGEMHTLWGKRKRGTK